VSPLRLGPGGERRIDPVLAVCVTIALVAVLGFLCALFALSDPRPDLTGLFLALAAGVPAIITAGVTIATRRLVKDNHETTNVRAREAAADAVRAAVAPVPRVPIERATDHMTESELAGANRAAVLAPSDRRTP
jgi:hypothetical protein